MPSDRRVEQAQLRFQRITSSARSSKGRGIVIPSAAAVFRLIASPNRVGCCTGSAPGILRSGRMQITDPVDPARRLRMRRLLR
jgi:hypothetical protein